MYWRKNWYILRMRCNGLMNQRKWYSTNETGKLPKFIVIEVFLDNGTWLANSLSFKSVEKGIGCRRIDELFCFRWVRFVTLVFFELEQEGLLTRDDFIKLYVTISKIKIYTIHFNWLITRWIIIWKITFIIIHLHRENNSTNSNANQIPYNTNYTRIRIEQMECPESNYNNVSSRRFKDK